jgi:conserved oligomeric Golgi complex subunit 6
VNPISLRLNKVLGTNFNDKATREALETLSALYCPPPPATSTSTSSQVPSSPPPPTRTGAANTVTVGGGGGLWSIGKDGLPTETVPGESAARARKNLKVDMELKLAEESQRFLDAFEDVEQVRWFATLFIHSFSSCYYIISYQFSSANSYILFLQVQNLTLLQSHLANMRVHAQEAEKHLALTHTASQGLLERAGSLREERYVNNPSATHQ